MIQNDQLPTKKKRTLNHRPGRFRSTTPFRCFNGTSQGDLVIHLAHLKLLRWELFRCHRIKIQEFDPNVESMFTVCIYVYIRNMMISHC